MKVIVSIFCWWYLVVTCSSSHAQTRRVDSLLARVHSESTDTRKMHAILDLSDEHQSIHRDTLDQLALAASQLGSSIKSEYSRSVAALFMGLSYLRWGWADSSLAAVKPYLDEGPPSDPQRRHLYYKLARVQAMSFGSKSNFKDALSVLYKLVSDAEKLNDSLVVGMNLNTIASISIARERYTEALHVLHNARPFITQSHASWPTLAALNTNYAQAYLKLGVKDSAKLYIKEALHISREVENLNTLATALRVQSTISISSGDLEGAEDALKEMIEVRKLSNDRHGVVDDKLMLVDLYLQTNQADKAIEICEAGLKQGDIYGEGGNTYNNNINLRLLYYEALARAYKATGNNVLYQSTLEQLISAKDSFYKANSAQAIADLQVKYEVQKKETTITRQQLDLTRKNFLTYAALLSTLAVAVTGMILFKSNRRKQKTRMWIMQQEEKRLAAEAIKDAEEAERKRIAADLHDSLGAYAASIVSIVDLIKPSFAKNQNTIIEELGMNAQSIVSQLSDTIWVLKKDTLPLTAISDRLKTFTQRVSNGYPAVTIDIVERIEKDHLLSPSQSFHLFQIIKEAVTNSLRHSGCERIHISIEGAAYWRVTIIDNGKGMAGTMNRSEGGNGLENMQRRAQESGCSIEWQQNHPNGTAVIIESLLRNA